MDKVKKETNIRLNVPKGRRGVVMELPSEDFVYGMPTKPPTPIKNVICNYYGEVAAALTERTYKEYARFVSFLIYIIATRKTPNAKTD